MNHVWADPGPITPRVNEDLHPTREGHKGTERIYIVAGGSGFIGTWLVRYLLLRGERSVYILDQKRPPGDVLRHGAIFVEVELSNGPLVENCLAKIAIKCTEFTRVVAYNCSVSRAYWAVLGSLRNLQASETLYVNLAQTMPQNSVCIIHIGDSMAFRKPVQWYKWWSRQAWCQNTPDDTLPILPFGLGDRLHAFSTYAWSQGAVEMLTRSSTATASATLRVDGFVSGHADDDWLSPALQYGGGLLHSWGVPISIVHVEDVVRAALALEYVLIDSESSKARSGSVYTFSSDEVTSLDHVYEYVQRKIPGFRVIRVSPIVAYLLGWVVSFWVFVSTKLGFQISNEEERAQSVLKSSPSTLTLARFSTMQIGQLPNPANARRLTRELQFRPNFTLSQTLDGVIDESMFFKQNGNKK